MKDGVLHGPKGLAGQLMRKHDSEAGRRAVRSRMQRVCKCHGEPLMRPADNENFLTLSAPLFFTSPGLTTRLVFAYPLSPSRDARALDPRDA